MKTIASPPTSSIFLHRNRDRDSRISCCCSWREEANLINISHGNTVAFFFPPNNKLSHPGFFHLTRVKKHTSFVYPVLLASSSSQVDLDTGEPQNQRNDQSKKVHIKFKLLKECAFGEQFFVVGDDPMIGSWDPESALPMNWSNGHVWIVELDVPIRKSVQFKFILKGVTGTVLWQPGPDRCLEPWETENTIVVWEDWENAEFQKIVEEEPFSNRNGESTLNTEMLVVAENLTYNEVEVVPDSSKETAVADLNSDLAMKSPEVSEKKLMIADNITLSAGKREIDEEKYEKRSSHMEDKTVAPADKNTVIGEGIQRNNGQVPPINATRTDVMGSLITHEEDPVLVPGLSPSSATQSETDVHDESNGCDTINASDGLDEVTNCDLPELDMKCEIVRDLPREHAEEACGNKKQIHDERLYHNVELEEEEKERDTELGNDVMCNDIQWGRKTLQKLLTNFGLL